MNLASVWHFWLTNRHRSHWFQRGGGSESGKRPYPKRGLGDCSWKYLNESFKAQWRQMVTFWSIQHHPGL